MTGQGKAGQAYDFHEPEIQAKAPQPRRFKVLSNLCDGIKTVILVRGCAGCEILVVIRWIEQEPLT